MTQNDDFPHRATQFEEKRSHDAVRVSSSRLAEAISSFRHPEPNPKLKSCKWKHAHTFSFFRGQWKKKEGCPWQNYWRGDSLSRAGERLATNAGETILKHRIFSSLPSDACLRVCFQLASEVVQVESPAPDQDACHQPPANSGRALCQLVTQHLLGRKERPPCSTGEARFP